MPATVYQPVCLQKSHRHAGHDERMREHAERVRAEDPGRNPVMCWACGDELTKGVRPADRGWFVRQLANYHYGDGTRIREIYCPGCFEEYGWGD